MKRITWGHVVGAAIGAIAALIGCWLAYGWTVRP
jgi:hypothetical protein